MGPGRSSKFLRRHRSTFGGTFRHTTTSNVSHLHPVKFGWTALPESAAALQRWGVRPTNNAGPPSGSSINVFHGPNRGDPRREAVLPRTLVHVQLSDPNLCRASSRIAVESGFVSQLTIGHTSSKDIVPVVPKYSAAWMRAPCTRANSSAATRQSSAGRCQHVTETTCINQPPSRSATVWERTRDAPGPQDAGSTGRRITDHRCWRCHGATPVTPRPR